MPVQCQVCQRKFNRKKEMQEHTKIHTASKVHTCETCKEQFLKIEDFDHHVKRHRPKTPVCQICQKICIDYYKLARHLRKHTGEKPFVCLICEKSFADKFSFERHELIHKSDKPFVCSICDRGYESLETLQKHLQTHDNEGFDCEVCGRSFPDKTKMQRHVLTHTNKYPEVCDICQKAFKQSSTLKRHYLTHMEGKEYSCDVCNATFTMKNQLTQHYYLHNAKKDHSCEYCDKSFPHARQLYTHVQVSHKECLQRKRAILPNILLERVQLIPVKKIKPSPLNMNHINKLGIDISDDFADTFLVPVDKMNKEINKESEVTNEINVDCLPLELLSSSLRTNGCNMTDSEIADALNSLANIPIDNSAAFKDLGIMNDLEDILIIPQEKDFPIDDSAEIVEPQ